VLEALGQPKSRAVETVQRFRMHDEQTMAKQFSVKDDENKFLETSRESADQLLQLFEADSDADAGAVQTGAEAQTGSRGAFISTVVSKLSNPDKTRR
jgi:hypothetical protein